MNEVIIRRMTMADVRGVHRVEETSFAIPWSEQSFREEMERNVSARYLVAVKDDQIIGFAGIWVILDEGHITNIAVLPEHRGQGIGRRLAEGILAYASNLGVTYVTLEVRKSNETAQNLYKSLGFLKLGVRKRYYSDNDEDALLMVTQTMPTPDPDFEEEETVHED